MTKSKPKIIRVIKKKGKNKVFHKRVSELEKIEIIKSLKKKREENKDEQEKEKKEKEVESESKLEQVLEEELPTNVPPEPERRESEPLPSHYVTSQSQATEYRPSGQLSQEETQHNQQPTYKTATHRSEPERIYERPHERESRHERKYKGIR
jgi:hypothetical protein